MLSKTKIDDIASRMTEKRLALTLTFHAVGRGGETKYLDWKNISFNHWMDCLEVLWTELKTLSTYSCPFVPNKDGYLTDVLHALACFFVLGKGLFRGSSSGKKVSTKVMPYLSDEMAHGNVSRWLTTAIRQNFPARVPEEEKKKVTAKSLRLQEPRLCPLAMLTITQVTQEVVTFLPTKDITSTPLIFCRQCLQPCA